MSEQPASNTNDPIRRLADELIAAIREAQPLIVPELLTATQAARWAGVSVSKWRDLDSRGLCPAPVLIGDGNCPRFRLQDLKQWAAHDCCSRSRFEVIRATTMRRSA